MGAARFMWFVRIMGIVMFLGVLYVAAQYIDIEFVKEVAEQHRILGGICFGTLMFITTVLAPLTSLPLVPIISPILGPLTTSLACFTGWFLGALFAFWIARTFGKPCILKYTDLTALQKYDQYLTNPNSLMLMVMLRVTLPVDILSYGLGLMSAVSFRVYALGTALGIVWFSFVFSYIGHTLVSRSYVLFACLGVASMAVYYFSLRYLKRRARKTHDTI